MRQQCATFLSNEVTHVITARELVTVKELEDEKENTVKLASSRLRQQEEHIAGADGHGKMLLEQHATDGARIRPPRSAFTFEAPSLSKAVQTRQATQSTAVSQARKMGKKVWSAHKLIKILDAILNNDSQRNSLHRPARGTDQQVKQPEKELQNLLRHEKLHGPADRDRSVPVKEEVPFVGHYFVINDMNGQYKPIMIREYPKPAGGFTEGDWPQFRTSTQGRSPFLLDEAAMRKRQKAEEAAIALQKSGQAITRSRAALVEKYAMNPPLQRSRIPSNREQIGGKHVGQINGHSREPSLNSGNFLPTINRTSSANAGSWGTFRDMSSRRGMWEPAASGVQPSNVTSAIRSQSISSAAVIPGSRAAISKNVIDLKRRAFENNSAPHRLTHSQGMSNLNAVAEGQQQPAPVRPLKRRIGEQLDVLDEEETSVLDAGPDEHPEEADDLSRRKAEAEQACRQAARAKRVLAAKKQTAAASEQQQQQPPERVKKPGYCENCREKYEDFDVHVVGPRHRKFAVDRRNWADLDQLLVQVRRPMRQEVRWGC